MVCHRNKTKSTVLAILLLTVNSKGMNPLLPLADTKPAEEKQLTITTLEYTCPDVFECILTRLVDPNDNDKNAQARINHIFNNVSPNKAITYTHLILKLIDKAYFLKLSDKTNVLKLSDKTDFLAKHVLHFMNQIMKKYNNTNKHSAFFNAFSDAKALFYYFPYLSNKIKSDGWISEKEYAYLNKKKYLLKSNNGPIAVPVESKFNWYLKKVIPQNIYHQMYYIAFSVSTIELIQYSLPKYMNDLNNIFALAGLLSICMENIGNDLLDHYKKPTNRVIFLDDEQAEQHRT